MVRCIAMMLLGFMAGVTMAQTAASVNVARPKFEAFEVATIKPVEHSAKSSRFIVMQGTNRFVEKDYTLKLLIAAAYNVSPRTIAGGPGWMDADHYDIVAVTPGEVRPTHEEQMKMLRALLTERFKLAFHREQKTFSIYELEVVKGGPKLRASAEAADVPAALISIVYPEKVALPARNATMGDLVSLMQRSMLDRPVVDKTGLKGRWDFDLTWAPDETQFGGELTPASEGASNPPLFTALQQELGLKLVATRGPVDAIVVDRADHPTAN